MRKAGTEGGRLDTPVRSYVEDNRILAARFDQWLEIQNYAVNTRLAYNGLLRDFCRFIRSRSLTEIKRMDIREYLAHLQGKGLASPSLDLKLHILRSFYGFLSLGSIVSSNPARFVSTRRRHRKLPHFPTIEEVEKADIEQLARRYRFSAFRRNRSGPEDHEADR